MKMKHHTVFILQNNLLKNMLIYYYYWNLKTPTVLIKEIDRFMTNKTKYHGKKHFCWFCLQCFSSSRVLECYVKNCLVINHTKSVLLPEGNECVNFQNFKRLIKTQFIKYSGFECV